MQHSKLLIQNSDSTLPANSEPRHSISDKKNSGAEENRFSLKNFTDFIKAKKTNMFISNRVFINNTNGASYLDCSYFLTPFRSIFITDQEKIENQAVTADLKSALAEEYGEHVVNCLQIDANLDWSVHRITKMIQQADNIKYPGTDLDSEYCMMADQTDITPNGSIRQMVKKTKDVTQLQRFIRTEETIDSDGQVIDRETMSANYIIVTLNSETTSNVFQANLQEKLPKNIKVKVESLCDTPIHRVFFEPLPLDNLSTVLTETKKLNKISERNYFNSIILEFGQNLNLIRARARGRDRARPNPTCLIF
jgi:hypothetical protein